MNAWFQNGGPVEYVPVASRAFSYGDGIFETIAIRNGKPRLWDLHAARLIQSCERLGIVAPSVKILEEEIHQALLASRVGTQNAIAKIVVAANFADRGYRRPIDNAVDTYVGIFDSHTRPKADYTEGVAVMRCETAIAIQPALAGIKSLNRLEQVLARNEWDSAEVFEGLMCNAEDQLICGTMSNVFVVNDNSIATPALNRCGVAGVMRRHVINVLLNSNIIVQEMDIDWDIAMSSDELFITNSQFGMLPVCTCDENEWPVGPVTRSTMSLMHANGVEECAS